MGSGQSASSGSGGGSSSGANTPAAAATRLGSRQALKRKLDSEYFVQKVQLGTGSFGVVHRAIHKPTQEDRAVKSIDKRRLEMKPNHRQHLQREIEIMRECFGHNNIVKLFDWFEDEHYIHLVLEYCGGGDFGDRIMQLRESITEHQACGYMYQILLAVDHLHSKGVCHRDIKPENFLISPPAVPGGSITLKLSDFGLAIRLADPKKSTLRELAGTPAYQAPEIHNLNNLPLASGSDMSSVGYGLSVDVWACGVTLFVILSGGKNPFVNPATNKLQLTDIRAGNVRFDDLCVVTSDDRAGGSGQQSTLTGRLFGRGGSSIGTGGEPGAYTSGAAPSRLKPSPSSNAEQLLRIMLTVDPSRRITTGEALRHNWFVQHGLASPPPASPTSAPPPDRMQMSVDSSSLEASPPAMEPILIERNRPSALSFDLNIVEDPSTASPTMFPASRRTMSGGSPYLPPSSLTIGPKGCPEGKVTMCDTCKSFFYSKRGVSGICPECREQLGFSLPVDGVGAGMTVYVAAPTAGGSKGRWKSGVIDKFLSQSGDFQLLDGTCVSGTSVAPPGKDVGSGAAWPNGTSVVYLSSSYGTWLPATIQSFNEQTRMYDLDVKAQVSADKIRARVKRITTDAASGKKR